MSLKLIILLVPVNEQNLVNPGVFPEERSVAEPGGSLPAPGALKVLRGSKVGNFLYRSG